MATKTEEAVDLDALTPDEEARIDAAVLERMRAAGVRLATASPNRRRVRAKQRPAWLAFIVRSFRLDRE
jgi:pyruvate-formate lyase